MNRHLKFSGQQNVCYRKVECLLIVCPHFLRLCISRINEHDLSCIFCIEQSLIDRNVFQGIIIVYNCFKQTLSFLKEVGMKGEEETLIVDSI